MSSNDTTTPSTALQGRRVRQTATGTQGRIVWATTTTLKIRWEDGEADIWRRNTLADRGVEILNLSADALGTTPHNPEGKAASCGEVAC